MRSLRFSKTYSKSINNHPFNASALLFSIALYRLALWSIVSAFSFSVSGSISRSTGRKCFLLHRADVCRPCKDTHILALQLSNNDGFYDDDDDDDDCCGKTAEAKKKTLALTGSCSTNSTLTSEKLPDSSSSAASKFGFVASEKFELQYTCKICDFR